MKRIVIINGLIAGAIVTSWIFVGMAGFFRHVHSLLIGYTTMIVAFSLIFVSVKSYRDKQNGGAISFGKAFQIGLFITLIASTIYVGVWFVDYYFFIPDFFESYSKEIIAEMKAKGASQAEIAKQAAQMKAYGIMYKNPIYNALFTYAEILPVGLVVTLLCALVLKRNRSDKNLAMAGY